MSGISSILADGECRQHIRINVYWSLLKRIEIIFQARCITSCGTLCRSDRITQLYSCILASQVRNHNHLNGIILHFTVETCRIYRNISVVFNKQRIHFGQWRRSRIKDGDIDTFLLTAIRSDIQCSKYSFTGRNLRPVDRNLDTLFSSSLSGFLTN